MKKINIIIPVYDEEENIDEIYNEIKSLKISHTIEFIFVDDGSKDGTLKKLKNLSKDNKLIKYISFSRNFGHQIALSAGLDHSDGDIIIMMDADLQHPVKYIPVMIKKYEQGYKIVQMVKKTQGKRNFIIKFFAYFFYSFLRIFSDINISNNVSDFRLIDNQVNLELKKIKEKERFLRGLVQWVGFSYTEVQYEPKERKYGT